MSITFKTYPQSPRDLLVKVAYWRAIERMTGTMPMWHPECCPAPASLVLEINHDIARIESDFSRRMTVQSSIELGMHNWKALENMKTGCASDVALEIIVGALNIALALCEMGFGAECIPQVNEALAWAFRAKERGEKTGRWGFDGGAIRTVTEVMEIHDQQLEHASKAEVIAAIELVRERIAEGNVYTAEPCEK